jgi:hypothetical protein
MVSIPQVAYGAEGTVFFEMVFSPSWELVSVVRKFAGVLCEQVLTDGDLASRVALATHELLENAVKYSVDGKTTIRMDVDLKAARPCVTVRTRNRVTHEQAAVLVTKIDEIAAAPDALGHFQTLMRRTAKSTQRGGLGLGRIAAEADMQLSYALAGDVVEVTAIAIPEVTR